MKLNQRAKKFAATLLEISGEDAGAVRSSLKQIDILIRKDARFRSLLQSKRISNDNKTTIIKEALADVFHPNVIDFLGLMTEEKSVNIIRQIIKAYDELYKEKKDIVSVKAHVAKELNAEEVDALQQNLQKAINKKADMTVEVDEKLLGGIMLRIENIFLDATLQSNLNRLQGELLQS